MPDFYSAYNSLSTAKKQEAYDFVLFLLSNDSKHKKTTSLKKNTLKSKDIEIGPITKSLSGIIPDDGCDYKEVIAEAIIEKYESIS